MNRMLSLLCLLSLVVGCDRPRMTQEEFRNATMSKTQEQVIKAVGKPDSTQEFGGVPTWYYEGFTNTLTGNKQRAQVNFEKTRSGEVKVYRVNFP